MKSTAALLECVPNFSEGCDSSIIQAIAAPIRDIAGQKLLHIDSSPAANRTVFTFAGSPEAVIEAAFQSIKVAAAKIDMRQQKGAHPRIGATDVCPLVPLAHMSMDEAVHWSVKLGEKVADQLGIPVYLYEYSAREAHKRALPDIRKGQYENLMARMQLPAWHPDLGEASANTFKTGATIIGARDILVAFNISLNTKDEKAAALIAKQMRSSNNGLLPALRAIGWYMEDFGCAQVSMNLLDYRITSPLKAWDTCKLLAAKMGLEPIGCEVIGLISEVCLLEAGQAALGQTNAVTSDSATLVAAGIQYLQLDKVKAFVPEEKILEYALEKAGIAL